MVVVLITEGLGEQIGSLASDRRERAERQFRADSARRSPASAEILFGEVCINALMAKHGRGRRRRFRTYLRGQIDLSIDLGTLAPATGIKTSNTDTVNENTWVTSVECTYQANNITQAAGLGPLRVLICHSDYSLVEVEEWIESSNSWNTGDLISQEIMKRKIRNVGILGPGLGTDWNINDNMPVKTKLNWQLTTGQTVAFVLYNTGTAAFATSDPDVEISGVAHLWPQ